MYNFKLLFNRTLNIFKLMVKTAPKIILWINPVAQQQVSWIDLTPGRGKGRVYLRTH